MPWTEGMSDSGGGTLPYALACVGKSTSTGTASGTTNRLNIYTVRYSARTSSNINEVTINASGTYYYDLVMASGGNYRFARMALNGTNIESNLGGEPVGGVLTLSAGDVLTIGFMNPGSVSGYSAITLMIYKV